MRERLKRWIFGLLGKDPDGVVVTFASGPRELAERMLGEVRELIPDRRHFVVWPEDFHSAGELARRLRGYRIALAPVLFTNDPVYAPLRRAAFLLSPTKILAYNGRLERHHLKLSTCLASLLFIRGVPLDRIYLRPAWLMPWKRDRSVYATTHRSITGRDFSPRRRRIAILTPYFPYPLAHGGAVRIFNLIREISPWFDIVLFSFTDQDQTDLGPLPEHCARIVLVRNTRYREPRWSTVVPPEAAEFWSPCMRRLIRDLRVELQFELLQVEYTALAPYAGDILVEHDVTFSLYRQIERRQPGFDAFWNRWRWERFEQRWLRRYRTVVVMSGQDRDLIAQRARHVAIIPNGVDLSRFRPEHERPGRRLLFVGSFRHFPNVVALRFFLEEVWPRIAGAKLTVVAGHDPLLHWRQHTGTELPQAEAIDIRAFVADVRPLYIEANVVIVPTLESAGTNLKVLEALAMARAVVSTTSGCAGLGLQHGVDVLIADEPGAFAQAVNSLLDDSDRRLKIAEAGWAHAERYDWRHIGLRQRQLFRQMMHYEIPLRPATTDDVSQIFAIQDTSPEASQWLPEDYLNFDCTVAEADQWIVGFLVSRPVAPGEREILNIAVHPEYRRLGIAKKLIRNEIDRWRTTHFLEVRQSNAAARSLYRSLGFEEVGVRPGYYEHPPEPGIVMRFCS